MPAHRPDKGFQGSTILCNFRLDPKLFHLLGRLANIKKEQSPGEGWSKTRVVEEGIRLMSTQILETPPEFEINEYLKRRVKDVCAGYSTPMEPAKFIETAVREFLKKAEGGKS